MNQAVLELGICKDLKQIRDLNGRISYMKYLFHEIINLNHEEE